MKRLAPLSLALCAASLGAGARAATTITIATVNNPDMVTMQKLTPEFTKKYPDINVKWVVLPENELRQKVTLDVASNAGGFDVATVGTYEVPIWAKNGWLDPLNPMFSQNAALAKSYDLTDVLEPVRKGLSYNGQLYALPFYAESSMTYYNKDLFKKAGLTMPAQPTWAQIEQFAAKIHNPSGGVYGVCLRGLPGWGENMALFDTMVNTFGGRWYDQNWNAQLNSPAWKNAMTFYVDLVKKYGPPGATSNGFTENLTLMSQGKCGMWVDATVAAGFLKDPTSSKVVNSIGFTNAPIGPGTPRGSNWLWSWSLAIPKSTKKEDAAFKFITWATSKDYIALVAREKGSWAAVPPGTRNSTYANPNYTKAAGDFARLVLNSIKRADPTHPTKDPVPYTGIQFVGIPQFQALGTQVGQYLAGALSGQSTVDQALAQAQTAAQKVAKEGGYQK
ncbi:sugar ABC transporter substrate-binding protein (plasmid) [Deinococcus metallilatus]|uniref:Sorbitol/mannitol transport system substrate-binding protein n=1 Tax=Deinococcus metallilatus TaxID=1211322 RepID=A0AAJ5K014_9DEIO|nr:sugar ABC transporter substrate-binding protein [Deinococcus metallilatus]MBB5297355.1 sorbitol/mannitol transport system substrate-binding protein [Deinococcus metallilatus]QBY06924.1 sugar ABC transporter substrate-binding protein [Deinococcus metallilatus]TLK32314.1 sugar ABC transporter substrate-binding protein [Deinococcus metallilatus]GMA17060.1 maltose ABC transporter substrate-binding protein [Deinococcus metallilatus]